MDERSSRAGRSRGRGATKISGGFAVAFQMAVLFLTAPVPANSEGIRQAMGDFLGEVSFNYRSSSMI